MLFSFTSVFSKLASQQFNKHGLFSAGMIGFSFLMLLNCFVYAIAWQKVIKKFDLNVAYANRTVYLIWSQIWAVFIFHESLTVTNMIGLLVVFIGVLVVQKYMWLLFIGTFFSAFSQLLLKQSANKTYKNPIFEYLNWRVILSYGIFAAVLFLNTYAYTKVDMKYGAVIDTFTYVFVMVLSYFILKEKFTKEKLIGNLIIMSGVFIYTLPF